MASKTLSLFFSLHIFIIISATGRLLQKNYTGESVDDLSHAFSFATTYTGKTNYSDVSGLIEIVTKYTWLEETNDDPCVPPVWSWIECNSDASPRIIALYLRNKILVDALPDFSSMDALQTIDLSINFLTGTIPSFLGGLPDLKELNLGFNSFSGLVPDSLACNKDLNITVDAGLYVSKKCAPLWKDYISTPSTTPDVSPDNSNIPAASDSSNIPTSTIRTSSKKKKSKLPAILGSSISSFAVFWIAFGIFAIYRHKAKAAAAIADASKQGPSDSNKDNIPMEERAMNDPPNHMTP